jgi:hypothetical protein
VVGTHRRIMIINIVLSVLIFILKVKRQEIIEEVNKTVVITKGGIKITNAIPLLSRSGCGLVHQSPIAKVKRVNVPIDK